MNNILNIMLFYGLMVYLPFSRRHVFRRSSYHNPLHNIENEQYLYIMLSYGLMVYLPFARRRVF